MEYVNSTTVTLALIGVGMGVYYVYVNIIEPQNKLQRALLAEKAQKELLSAHEQQLAKRGSNKQAKKKPVFSVTPKKQESDKDEGPQEVDENVSVSNPFDILNESPAGVKSSKKEAPKIVPVKQPLLKQATTVETDDSAEAPFVIAVKTVKFNPTPSEKSPTTTTSTKKNAQVKPATVTSPPPSAQPTVKVPDEQTAPKEKQEELKTVLKKSKKGPSPSKNLDPEQTAAPQPYLKASPVTEPVKPVVAKASKIEKSKNTKEKLQPQTSQPLQASKAPMAPVTPATPAVSAAPVSEQKAPNAELTVPLREHEALQALLKARELALVAADARADRTKLQILELQKQLEVNADLVKSAKKAQARAQSIESKIESLNYTNSLLVNQLSLEKEHSKEAQAMMFKASKMQENAKIVQELEAKVLELEQERAHIRAQVDQMAELNHDLQQQRTQSESEAEQLLHSLNDAERRVDSALRERNENHQQLSKLLAEKDSRISTLEAEIGAMEGELESLRLQMESYNEAMGHAEGMSHSREETFKGEKHALLEEIDMLRSQLSQETTSKAEKESEARKAENMLQMIREELTKAQEQHRELSFKHEAALTECKEKEKELSEARSRAQELTVEVATVKSNEANQLQAHQQEFERVTKELEQSSSQISALMEKQEALASQVVDMTARSTENTTRAQEQTMLLEKRIEELTEQVNAKESSHKCLLDEKNSLTAQLDALQKDRQALSILAESKAKEVDNMIRDKEKLALEYSQKYEWTSSLVKEKETLVAVASKKSSEVESLTKEKEILTQEKSELAAEMQQLKTQLDAKTTEMEAEHKAISARVAELESQLNQRQQPSQQQPLLQVKESDLVPQEETFVFTVADKKVEEESKKVEETFSVQEQEGVSVATY
ncbi:hypothetical protein BGZ94_008844 [Podila epigama]|nr:hypothetical protein BGZ94_008844 [Podila epigama]